MFLLIHERSNSFKCKVHKFRSYVCCNIFKEATYGFMYASQSVVHFIRNFMILLVVDLGKEWQLCLVTQFQLSPFLEIASSRDNSRIFANSTFSSRCIESRLQPRIPSSSCFDRRENRRAPSSC